ncbi:MAG: hypothetical protein COA97_10630 [Flavobacteriales bacterium]|nr:MAG: hypothetical protein COA97_10630 [Flavobacteriales bacterium]
MENNTALPQEDPGKIVGILAYCTGIGLIIAFVMNADQKNKSELGVFHLRQSLGLFITSISMMIISFMFVFIPILGWMIVMLINLAYIGVFVFWIMGLISAINGEKKALPLVGQLYQNLLKGIK